MAAECVTTRPQGQVSVGWRKHKMYNCPTTAEYKLLDPPHIQLEILNVTSSRRTGRMATYTSPVYNIGAKFYDGSSQTSQYVTKMVHKSQ